MNGMVRWFARNHVAANLLMVVILAAGAFSVANVKLEVFPEFSADLITVTVPYLGAAPEEVEEGVLLRIEERIQDLEGIKRINSTAVEGRGTVVVELLPEADVREVLDEVKARVDAIDTFPEQTEQPVIQEVILRRQVINVAIFGEADEATLKRLGERVRDDLLTRPGITQVDLAAARPYEISIEVSEEALRRHQLTFDQVAQAVRRSSLDLPGGSIKSEGGEILLRTTGQAYRGPEFESLVLLTRPDGTRLLLGDVARVVDGFAETDQSARFDGNPTVLVQVFRVGEQDALDVAGEVYDYVEEAESWLPQGISMTTWQDDTQVLRSRLDLMLRNGRAGLILVFLVLAFFLRLRLAGWVALGIPISFFGALALMPILDISINLISLFAFIVVLGIVVDDAIVVGENIYRQMESGKKPLKAAIEGAQEVAVPVTFSILTTIAAFGPLVFVPGNSGKIMKVIPLIVIPTLIFSLVESLCILPAHLGHSRPRRKGDRGRGPMRWWRGVQERFTGRLERFIINAYRPSLERALRWRYTFVAGALAVLMISFALVAGGWLRFNFFPPVEADNVAAFLSMPQGTPAEVTERAVQRIEGAALELQEELKEEQGSEVFRHTLASVGEQPFRQAQSQNGGNVGSSFSAAHIGEVAVELVPAEDRDITSPEIAARWREKVGQIPDATELTFSSSLFSAGEAINVQLSGPSLDSLVAASERLQEDLRAYPGVFDITDSFEKGKQELQLDITPEAQALGLTLSDLARQVRQAFYGEEAQRVQRGREEIKVMVRYPEDQRQSLGSLEEMRVRTPGGVEVPFTSAATYHMERGFATIQRTDRQRVVNVTADVDPKQANANEIIRDLESRVLPRILADFQGLRYTFEGEQREQRDTLGGVLRGFLFALLIIYALLAIPFRSYLQPIIVMAAIPFGLIGALWGHVLMGINLSLLSMFGIVALTGVVVNDSLVMVDFINRHYQRGLPLMDALRKAGEQRFRPILLTSLTTFAGLLPLLLEQSLQAQFLIPMAVSLAFGVLFATFITLMLVPVSYTILEDFKHLFGRSRWRRRHAEEEAEAHPGEVEEGEDQPRDSPREIPHGAAPEGA
ncbi:MAG: efflux RND transporter permease subunit [Acidobacteriota bacterium]|nr:efflux RND transporter permease subunit [Acidobacteriota bacterium]